MMADKIVTQTTPEINPGMAKAVEALLLSSDIYYCTAAQILSESNTLARDYLLQGISH